MKTMSILMLVFLFNSVIFCRISVPCDTEHKIISKLLEPYFTVSYQLFSGSEAFCKDTGRISEHLNVLTDSIKDYQQEFHRINCYLDYSSEKWISEIDRIYEALDKLRVKKYSSFAEIREHADCLKKDFVLFHYGNLPYSAYLCVMNSDLAMLRYISQQIKKLENLTGIAADFRDQVNCLTGNFNSMNARIDLINRYRSDEILLKSAIFEVYEGIIKSGEQK